MGRAGLSVKPHWADLMIAGEISQDSDLKQRKDIYSWMRDGFQVIQLLVKHL